MKSWILLLCLALSLLSQDYPKTYAQLGTPLFEQVANFKALSESKLLSKEADQLAEYLQEAEAAHNEGMRLEDNPQSSKKEILAYLKQLRKLQKLHDRIEKAYKLKLYHSINTDDSSAFYQLLKTPLPLLNSDARLKEQVVSYYTKSKKADLPYLESLSRDFKLDQKSYTYFEAMFTTKQVNQQIKRAKQIRAFKADPTRKKLLEVIMVKTGKGFDLYLENHAYYDITLELKATQFENLSASSPLPYIGSFPAQSQTKFLHFSVIDPSKRSRFASTYNSYIGRLTPQYDENYLYALPYTREKSYILTQGFNGKHTHKGKSAYALDFKMPIGSKVHAMREGVVVALESKQTEHGYSPAFADKSNYIVIQHKDGTMAMYGHLKPRGVHVRLGQKVYKHQFIGRSGNTGYSSGPHLHVHITAIKNISSGSQSIPFSFLSKQGRIASPQIKKRYTAK